MNKLVLITLAAGCLVSCSSEKEDGKGAVTEEARKLGVGESFEVKGAKPKKAEPKRGNVSAKEVNGVPQLTVDAFPE